MKKIKFTPTHGILSALSLLIMTACSEPMQDNIKISETKSFHLNSSSENLQASLKTNCYVFRDNTLHQIVKDISSSFSLSVPENASLYFFAGDTEPIALRNVEEGRTTIEEFLSIRTEEETHPEFYTGFLLETTSANRFDIPLRLNKAQIDLDATSSDLLEIHKVTAENAPTSSLLFEQDNFVSSSEKEQKVYELNPPVAGSKENILRLYESEVPVDFTVEGTYDGVPINFKASLPTIVRNYKYTLKVVNAGAKVSGVFEVKPWAQTDTINTAPNADKKVFIDKEHSKFPNGYSLNSSGDSLILPSTGGKVTLAFLGTSPIDFESIEDPQSKLDMDGTSSVSRESGKIMTQYNLVVTGQGDNTLPYSIVMKPKSVLRKYSSSQIVITVNSPSLYIREVTLGGLTWMAFNVDSKQDIIYPFNGNDVEAMYNNEWLASLGGMFQYGRLYKYAPWESGVSNQGNQPADYSWKDASKTPCPEGYRLPTPDEAIEFFGIYNGGGVVPATWTVRGEQITASLETARNSHIDINGITDRARYLKLSGSKGGVLYIPFGGMKSNVNPSNKNPEFSQGFRLWLSDEYMDEPSKAWCIYCGNPGAGAVSDEYKAILIRDAEKEAYAYARCIKK